MEWNDVFGYFTCQELYDNIIDEAPEGSTLVEVGVLCGRSLIYFAKKAKEANKNLKVVGVDWGLGTATTGEGIGPTANKLATNLRGCNSDAVMLLGESTNAARFFDDESVWFVFIDANHSYESVKADIEAWIPKVKRGGVIAGDDYGWEGVNRAVSERFGKEITIVGASWVHRKA